jgi:hypothetical protein
MDDRMVDETTGAMQPVNQLARAHHLGIGQNAPRILAFGSRARGQDRDRGVALQEDAPQIFGERVSRLVLGPHEGVETLKESPGHTLTQAKDHFGGLLPGDAPVGDVMRLHINHELIAAQCRIGSSTVQCRLPGHVVKATPQASSSARKAAAVPWRLDQYSPRDSPRRVAHAGPWARTCAMTRRSRAV